MPSAFGDSLWSPVSEAAISQESDTSHEQPRKTRYGGVYCASIKHVNLHYLSPSLYCWRRMYSSEVETTWQGGIEIKPSPSELCSFLSFIVRLLLIQCFYARLWACAEIGTFSLLRVNLSCRTQLQV